MKRALLIAVGLCGCSEDALEPRTQPVEGRCQDEGAADPFVDCVESFAPRGDAAFGHDALPDVVLGPPVGAGDLRGSMDVVSLGCGGAITLYFASPGIVDGDGLDFIVFENAFRAGEIVFVEPAAVLVSEDGIDWREFGCDPTRARGCAGLGPVHAADETTAVDPELAGGDAFDLAEVDVARAHYVRLVDQTREHYDSETWCVGESGGFDLDAIAAVPR